MRQEFFTALHTEMQANKDIIFVTADLGYFFADKIKEDLPDQFYNVQAAEQAGMGICIGLALSGKIPIFYSITPFLILRPFEAIRTYINHEKIPVIMVGSGRNDDYESDGISHNATDIPKIMEQFKNIDAFYPSGNKDMGDILRFIIKSKRPTFLSLSR